ncbi:MAG: isoprenylcysteine carboxylmethyltransferase family protein [Moorea sp. SIO3G5]|nr:isoprenylcysteine carboxylmethyltransferase family protein [Moorena sp. SIO3G5]
MTKNITKGNIMLILKSSALILLITCCASFYWAPFGVFTRPEGMTNGLRILLFLGTALMLIHVSAIVLTEETNLILGFMGLSIYISSLVLFWWAVKTTKDKPLSLCYSHDLPNHIVTTGPYKVIRNPFYTSYLLPGVAGILVTNQLWLILTVVVMFVPYYKVARQEESKFLASSFADEYKVYKESTGMFLPKLFRFSTPTAPSSVQN